MPQHLFTQFYELILAAHDAFCLHSSVIRYQDRAILFCGESGVGKSTQAALWQKEKDAFIINGDKGVVRKVDGKWIVFGSPFSGTSGIVTNECAEIEAVVFLSQGEENAAKRLGKAEMFQKLIENTIVPRWDIKATDSVMSQAAAFLEQNEKRIYSLRCRPDSDAVEALLRVLR